MATLAPLFFIGSSSFLQVTRTTIISRMGSNFSKIRPLTVELNALECLKNYFVLWHSAFNFDRIFFILGSNKDSHNISDEFEFQPDSTLDCSYLPLSV